MTTQMCPKCGSVDVEVREYYEDGVVTDQLFECKKCGETGDKYDFAPVEFDQQLAELHELALFEDTVRSNTDWWNSRQGTTCEFSTGYELIKDKMEILARYSKMLDSGHWSVHHCSACERHHEGKRNLHVMIWRNV